MGYQNLQADLYLEGDAATTLRLLTEELRSSRLNGDEAIKARWAHWEAEHDKLWEGNRSGAERTQGRSPIDPAWLCAAISESMPEDVIYVEETIIHRPAILRHVEWNPVAELLPSYRWSGRRPGAGAGNQAGNSPPPRGGSDGRWLFPV